MARKLFYVSLGILCLVAARPTNASLDAVYNVAQPLIAYDAGLIIGFEGYAGYGDLWPAGLVRLTCAENHTQTLGGSGSPFPHTGIENRNAANIVGLSIRHVPNEHEGSKKEAYFVDTLRVVLEVPQDAVSRDWEQQILASLRAVVCATIECARINAASQRMKVRFLDVRIAGWEEGKDLEGVYPLAGVLPAPDRQYGYDEEGKPMEEICPRE